MCSLMLTTPVFTSCGDDEDDPIENPGNNGEDENGKGDDENDVTVNGNKELTSLEQKQYLEQTGISFLEKVKAADFQNVTDLTRHIQDNYIDDYNCDAVEGWYDDCLEEISTLVDSYTEEGYWYNYKYNCYTRLYALSNFTGHFEAGSKRWTYTKADDLQFSFKDGSGNACVAKVVASGSTKKVYVGDEEDWVDWDYETDTEYIDYIDNYLLVPEKVTLTLTQGGTTIVNVILTTDLSSMSGEEFNINKDKYSASLSATINGYEWNLSKAAYDATKNASLTFTFKQGKTTLLTLNASADGKVQNDELASAKNLSVKMDILGNVQISGACTDAIKFADKLEQADDNDENEGNFKSYINEANTLLDLGVYYNGGSLKQATVKLEPFCDTDWGYNEWYTEPVIYFADGTSYSTFEAFFNETDFRDLIEAFEDLIGDFENL